MAGNFKSALNNQIVNTYLQNLNIGSLKSNLKEAYNKYQGVMNYVDTLGGLFKPYPGVLADPGILGAVTTMPEAVPYKGVTITRGHAADEIPMQFLEQLQKVWDEQKAIELAKRKARVPNRPNDLPYGEVKEIRPKVLEISAPEKK